MSPTCPFTLKDTAESYVLGHLPAAESQAFEEHLKACPECRRNVTETQEFRRLLRLAVDAQSHLGGSKLIDNVLPSDPPECGDDD